MEMVRALTCTICGEETLGDARWFLVLEDPWQDKLIVLHWNDRLAAKGVHCACSAEHLQEMVVHWMTTGSLDYPFARSSRILRHNPGHRAAKFLSRDFEGLGARQIGELSVHRESLQRALSESPQSLKTILDALSLALQQERMCAEPGTSIASRSRVFVRGA